MLENIIIVVHVLTAVAIVALILLQQGKGADMGASFGSGSSQTVFGAQGSGNVLTKSTAILATLFFLTSLGLAFYARKQADVAGQIGITAPIAVESKIVVPESDIPATPVPATTGAGEAGREDIPAAD